MINTFRDKSNATLHSKVVEKAEKTPYEEVNCHHIMMKSENYRDGKKWKQPFVSIWIDVDNNHIIEEVGSWTFQYIIPQWQKVSGSQYAYSPAVVAALPDARLLQAITLTLLEAGEKAVNPPMIATQDAVRGDVRLDGGSINWVDSAYDERLGGALRPITLDKSGLQFGIALREDIKQMLVEAFYLNKLQLPMNGPQMTATESTYRIQEWVRNAMPLFGPGASNYNEPLQEMDFKTLLHAGAFIQNPLPPSLRIEDIKFKFENPLVQTQGREKSQKFLEAKAMMAEAVAFDPSLANIIDAKTALRDALNGNGTPAKWLRDERVVEAMDQAQAQQQQAQQMLQTLTAGGAAAEQIGKGAQAIQQAGI